MWTSLTVHGTPAHVKCYSYHACTSVSVSGGGNNATVQDQKRKWNAQTQQSWDYFKDKQINMQLTMKSFRPLFPDKICSLTLPWYLVKSLTFPWQLSKSRTFPGFPDKWSPCVRKRDWETTTYWRSRHQSVKKSDGENSESNKHNSMPLQLYAWRNRRQISVVMSVDSFTDRVEHFVKTFNLSTPQNHIYTAQHWVKLQFWW